MISIEYPSSGPCGVLVVEHDERLLFWPFVIRGRVLSGSTPVERTWRGATLRDASLKAAYDGCLPLDPSEFERTVAELERLLERRT